MRFKNLVISQLNTENDFISSASSYFEESSLSIAYVVDLITEAAVAALSIKCEQNIKAEEFFKISKECAVLNFSDLFGSNLHIKEKGRGINSEIFGVDLINTVDEIAKETQVRNKTVNSLMASITPAILRVLHLLQQEKKYDTRDLCNYLKLISPKKQYC